MDKLSYDDDKGQLQPSPSDFEVFLPWACNQFQVETNIIVTKVLQHEYISATQSNTDRSRSRKTKAPPVPSRTEPNETSKTESPLKLQSMYTEGVVKILTTYDSTENLVQIKFDRNKAIPEMLIKIISMIVHFHPRLNSIVINRGVNVKVVHEVCNLLCLSHVTNICLDDTFFNESTYDVLLEKKSCLKQLSLARCKINDEILKKIASKLVYSLPASQTLSILNLSSNRITDEGAKYLGEALRSNRCISYLNLADNSIGDDGADCILRSLLEFPLKLEEQLAFRSKYIEYLKEKKDIINKILSEAKVPDFDKKTIRKKNVKPPVTTANKKTKNIEKEMSLKNMLEKNTAYVDDLQEKAINTAEKTLGPFNHPYRSGNTVTKDGIVYCTGNNTLCYLNLAYNNLSYCTVKKLLQVLQTQRLQGRKPRGLINICIEGNGLPIYCKELQKIDELLEIGLMMQDRRQSIYVTRKKLPIRTGK